MFTVEKATVETLYAASITFNEDAVLPVNEVANYKVVSLLALKSLEKQMIHPNTKDAHWKNFQLSLNKAIKDVNGIKCAFLTKRSKDIEAFFETIIEACVHFEEPKQTLHLPLGQLLSRVSTYNDTAKEVVVAARKHFFSAEVELNISEMFECLRSNLADKGLDLAQICKEMDICLKAAPSA